MNSAPKNGSHQEPDFLVFSDDWGEHPSSCQHIFRHIAKEHRVLWVNTIGMRNPTFTLADARKMLRKASKMLGARHVSAVGGRPEGKLTVCQPFMLPGIRKRVVRAFNTRSVTRKAGTLLRVLGFEDPVVVTTVPNAAEYPDLLRDRKVVYYCVDDFSLWPGLDAELVRGMESRLIDRADCLIAVSETLCQRLSRSGKPTRLLTHGVDLEMFSRPEKIEHPLLNSIPKPRAGFFGLIDGRMDWDLVTSLARQMPDTSFVFAGPVDASAGELPHRENLHFIGPIPYAELPKLISGLALLMLPYRTGLLAEALSPLKFKEYMATGKPVVCTRLAEARLWPTGVQVATSPNEWANAVRRALKQNVAQHGDQILRLLQEESWALKAAQFQSACA